MSMPKLYIIIDPCCAIAKTPALCSQESTRAQLYRSVQLFFPLYLGLWIDFITLTQAVILPFALQCYHKTCQLASSFSRPGHALPPIASKIIIITALL